MRPILPLLLLPLASLHAENEKFPTDRPLGVAMDHSGLSQVGPTLHHHHHDDEHHHHGAKSVVEHSSLEFELTLGADSHYISEGRDNLDDGGILWAELVGHVHLSDNTSFFGALLGIQAWDDNYQELNLTAGIEHACGPVTLSAAATYLWFPQEDGDDDDVELALGAEWVGDCGFGIAAEAVWSTEAEGWFGEAQFFYEIAVCQSCTIIPSILVGTNQNYVRDEHDGINHVAAQVEAAITLSDHSEASIYVAYSEPVDEQDGDELEDLFWGGASITWTF